MRRLLLPIACSLFVSPASGLDVWVSHEIDFTDAPRALRLDSKRNLIYVSIPNANVVAVIDPITSAVVKSLNIGAMPEGIDLSSDFNTLYTALGNSGEIGIYDLQNNTQTSIDASAALNSTYTLDVAETSPGIVFASAVGVVGAAYIARVDVSTATSTRVASNTVMFGPIFGKDPNALVLYVGDGYDPESLYKLDLTQVSAPIIQTSPFGELGGMTIDIAANPTGDMLVLGGGMVVRANELTEDGYVGPGVTLYSSDGSSIASAYGNAPLAIHRFDTSTLDEIEVIPTPCNFNASVQPAIPTAIVSFPGDGGWAVIAPNMLCITRRVPDEIFGSGFQ